MRRVFTTFLFSIFFVNGVLNAQYYETGQDPASLRWGQIITPHFRIVYPQIFSAKADNYARLLEDSYLKVSTLYPECKIRIPVIIHSYSMESNGYVSWAPKRMELFPLPGQENLPSDPAEQLIIHETTHVLQMASLNHGLSKILSFIAGEQAFGLSALLIPDWAFEGDAVYAETAFTQAGRGRSNSFLQSAMALTVNPDGIYRYDKMLLGSYKDFTPDHYVFGYLMLNQLRNQNPDAWRQAVRRAGSTLAPANSSLGKYTGSNEEMLYKNAFDSLKIQLQESGKSFTGNYPVLDLPQKNNYISHFSPHRIDNNRILSLKTSLTAPSAFVITDTRTKTEQLLSTTGYLYPFFFSFSGSTVVWSELHSDPRWDNLDYSVIKRMDISEGVVTQLTYHSRYTAPDISPDGKTIVAVSTTPDYQYSLVFINAGDGEKVMELAIPDSLIAQRPQWSSDGTSVSFITLSSMGEGIRTYFPTGKKWVINKPESVTDITQVKMVGDTLYYLAQDPWSDNIYIIAPDGSEKRITESTFGISGFSISGDEILFSDYSSDGFNISSTSRSLSSACSVYQQSPDNLPSLAILPSSVPDDYSPDSLFLSKRPYRKALHLFNFHSWAPVYFNLDDLQEDFTTIKPGFTLLSQNHLSTLISTIGYEYSNKMHYFHSGFEWRGWYPVIEADITYGGEQMVIAPSAVIDQPTDIGHDMRINLSISQPLYFSYSKFRQLFMPAIYMDYLNDYFFSSSPSNFNEGRVILTGRLYFYNIFRTAYRDIYPRWGQVVDLRLITAPWDKDLYSSLKYARGTLFLPGIVRNHSLVIKSGYEIQNDPGRYIYSNRNPYPRGYENLISQKLFTFSADYTMPLFYPDFAAWNIFYLKRIRSSFFYDFAKGWGTSDYNTHLYTEGATEFRSLGGELLADFFILRFPFEISTGVNGGYVPATQEWFVGPVFSVNIYGTTLGGRRR